MNTTPDLIPPDERFWRRYSKHHELPLSGLASAAFHLVIPLLLVIGLAWHSMFGGVNDRSIEFDVVTIHEPGGQGGADAAPILGLPTGRDVLDTIARRPEIPRNDVTIPRTDFPPPDSMPIRLPDEGGDLFVANPDAMKPVPRLVPLVPKGSPRGKTTSGTGIPGSGSGDGSRRILNQREKRQVRWTMLFRTYDARDYLRQLQALGAILGVQYRDERIALIRDLSQRPAELQISQKHPDRIFWMDDNPASVLAMCAELQVTGAPWRIIAYFPESMEQQLLEKELAYGKSFGRNSEEEIRETKFSISIRTGQLRIEVAEQR